MTHAYLIILRIYNSVALRRIAMADNQEIRLLDKQSWINRDTFFAARFRRNPEQYYMKRWPNFDPHTIITDAEANGFGKQLSDESRAPPCQPADPDEKILEYLHQFEASNFTRAIDRYLAVRAGDLSIPAFKWYPYDRPPLIITIPDDKSNFYSIAAASRRRQISRRGTRPCRHCRYNSTILRGGTRRWIRHGDRDRS